MLTLSRETCHPSRSRATFYLVVARGLVVLIAWLNPYPFSLETDLALIFLTRRMRSKASLFVLQFPTRTLNEAPFLSGSS